METLLSIDEIIQSLREQIEKVQDPVLAEKLAKTLASLPSSTDERWQIQGYNSNVTLPATASEKEIDEKIREMVSQEAENEDWFYMGSKDPIVREHMFEERVQIYKDQLHYYCYTGSILSHDPDNQLAQYHLHGYKEF